MNVDTLIIGSGVAAAAIAERLLAADANADVLILEAGGVVKMQDYATWTNYLITGTLPYTKYYDLPYPTRSAPGENLSVGGTDIPLQGARAMTYGGSTIHWGGWSFRLKPEDFSLQSNTGQAIDWPFDYQALEPYYEAAETYIGVSGEAGDSSVPRRAPFPFPAFPFTLEDQPVADAMAALGLDYGHVPIARRGMSGTTSRHAPCQTTGTCKYCPFGARYAATNYLNDMLAWEDYPNLHVRTDVVVNCVTMLSPTRAGGVECFDKTTRTTETIEAARIIVAAGSIESAKLLLRSISDSWPDGLGNQHDLVGRNFITHPYFIFDATLSSNPLALQPEMNFPTLCSRHFDSPAEQAAGKFILVNPPSSPSVNLAQQMQSGRTRTQLDDYIRGATGIEIHGMMEVFSHPENRVTNLLHKTNSLGLPQTVVDYTKDPSFDTRMQQVSDQVNQIFHQMGAEPVGKPTVSWRADHAACVTRMSRDEHDGVVDPDLRVHGLDNVYVCSNAVFPNTGTINPTLTLTALALRLAEHLILQGGEA